MKNNYKVICLKSVSLILAFAVMTLQCLPKVTYATMEKNDNYVAIVAEEVIKYASVVDISGMIIETKDMPELNNGIVNEMSCDILSYNEDVYINSSEYMSNNDIYIEAGMYINCENTQLNNNIMTNKDIVINTNKLNSDKFTILYSREGDIKINVSEINFYGLIYAPNGNVIVNGTEVNIAGCIIAKGVYMYVDKLSIEANEITQSIISFLEIYRNDKQLMLNGYVNEETIVLVFESDYKYESVDIYVRNDDEREFEYLMSTDNEECCIKEYTFEKYMDIIAVAVTEFGEKYVSSLITVGYSNDVYAEKLCSFVNDTDEDGLQDGIEIWYSKTDPYNFDSDKDGFSDYVECMYLYTDPNCSNEKNDSDKDGLDDRKELNVGTHPYLSDSDFDGIIDGGDNEPLKYNANETTVVNYDGTKIVGLFDKMDSWIDANGNLYQRVYNFQNDNIQYILQDNVMKKFYYNAYDQLTSVVVVGDEVNDYISYTYEGERLKTVTYNGFVYEFDFEENFESIRVGGNDYKKINSEDYVKYIEYANGFKERKILNEDGQISTIYFNEQVVFECNYNDDGYIVEMTDYLSDSYEEYVYNNDGTIRDITSYNYSIAYEYDEDKYSINYNILGKTYKQDIYNDVDGVYASQYSSMLISDELQEKIYLKDGSIEYRITDIDNDKITFSNILSYDDEYNLVKIIYNNGNKVDVEYDENGRIEKVIKNDECILEYMYDNRGRIVVENNALIGNLYEYTYDKNNNMIEKTTYDIQEISSQSIKNKDVYGYAGKWEEQITSVNGSIITYDEIGNPLKYRDDFIFEWKGKALSKAYANDMEIQYTYNAEGVRTSKKINGKEIKYVIEGDDVIYEICGENIIAYIYDSNMNVVGMIYNDEVYYFEKNVQNDIVGIINRLGETVCEYVYDAWGNIVYIDGDKNIACINPFRYRGYYYDEETSLYYVESRYYDPMTGRFVNPDKIEKMVWDYANLDMYTYCKNDPVNYIDPNGEEAIYLRYFVASDMNNLVYGADKVYSTSVLWLNSMRTGGTVSTYVIDGKQDFIDTWNSIVSTTAVIIQAHGHPYYLTFNNEVIYADEIRKSLKLKNVKFVWLTSCNAGHYDYRTDNIATAIANRITGYVIASDGTVYGVSQYVAGQEIIGFSSIADSEWSKYVTNGRIKSKYWMLYKRVRATSITDWYDWGIEIATIFNISDYLQAKGYVSFK